MEFKISEIAMIEQPLSYGGPGRIRTCNQTVMSGVALSEVADNIDEFHSKTNRTFLIGSHQSLAGHWLRKTDCVRRHGFLRRPIFGARGWKKASRSTDRRREPSASNIREFWAPVLCRAPWKKFSSPEHCLRSNACFACSTFEPVERAHIVPRWAGGSDGPVNLHLLCRMCHQRSEDLLGLEYWRWLSSQNYMKAGALGVILRIEEAFGSSINRADLSPLRECDLLNLAWQYAKNQKGALASKIAPVEARLP